jgi:biotin synthase
LDGDRIDPEQALQLLKADEGSPEMYAIISAANTLTRRQYANRGEVYGTIGINLWPCPKSCAFCSFGADWNLVDSTAEFTREQVVSIAETLEDNGANAIFLMTTADYPFERYIDFARAVREAIAARMPLVANIGDFGPQEAKALVDAGFQAVYHVVRLREGTDTRISSEERLRTIRAARNAGLDLSYCVEPIGPEHSPEELVTEMFRGRQFGAVNLACMWRVPVPELPLSRLGKISESTLARTVAVTRIVAGDSIRAMGVHEPGMLPLFAGANQIYAQTAGFSPRRRPDLEETSQNQRARVAHSMNHCRDLLKEAGYSPLRGPSRVFQGNCF